MSKLYRLVYTSFRKPMCDDGEIKSILETCQKNNAESGITGILLHSDSRFIQYLEGKKKNLEKLFEKIRTDRRHMSVTKRLFEKVDDRLFPSWEMGFKDIPKKGIKFETDISDSDKKIFKGLIENELDFSNDGVRVLQLFFDKMK